MLQYLVLCILLPFLAGCDWCECSKKASDKHTDQHKPKQKDSEEVDATAPVVHPEMKETQHPHPTMPKQTHIAKPMPTPMPEPEPMAAPTAKHVVEHNAIEPKPALHSKEPKPMPEHKAPKTIVHPEEAKPIKAVQPKAEDLDKMVAPKTPMPKPEPMPAPKSPKAPTPKAIPAPKVSSEPTTAKTPAPKAANEDKQKFLDSLK